MAMSGKKDGSPLTEVSQSNTAPEETAQNPAPETREVNTDFMKEEIRQRPVNKKKLLRRTLFTAFLAVMFGVIACAVFLFLEPVINQAINPSEEPAPVTFTESSTAATSDEMNPEDMIANDEQIQEQAAEEKAASSVDEIKQAVLSEVEQELAARQEQERADAAAASEEPDTDSEDSLQQTALDVQKSMVTVTTITQDYDWAGDAFNDTGSGSGLIIAEKGTDLLILANDDDYAEAGELRVTFNDGEQAPAKVVCTDSITDIVILSVQESDLNSPFSENDQIAVCTMGSSARADLLGRRVIAVGSPAGSQGSVSYGFITNSGLALDVTDSSFSRMTTDIYGSTQATGALADTDGEIIGWIDMSYNSSDSQNLISAVGITGIKPLIEKMSNEINAGYLGIHGTDVPEAVREEQGIPTGAYVLRTEMDSPAMEAGIQSGDVITDVGGTRISSLDVLMSILGQSHAGRQLDVTVTRSALGRQQEVELTVTLTTRFVFPQEQ